MATMDVDPDRSIGDIGAVVDSETIFIAEADSLAGWKLFRVGMVVVALVGVPAELDPIESATTR